MGLLWIRYIEAPLGETRLRKWRKEILPPPYQGLDSHEGEVDYSWQKAWDTNTDTTYNSLEFERAGNSGTELTPRSDLRIYGINLTRQLLSQIKLLVETHHGKFIIFKEERPWELQSPDKEKVYYLNDKYYKLSASQHNATLKDLFEEFEHYRLPLPIDNYTVSSKDDHLNIEAIDKLMNDLAFIISKKQYVAIVRH